MRINDVLNEGLPGGEYSRVLTALKLYYPDKFSMQELNTPEWHRVIANKADVPMEYAGDVIDGFVKASQRNDDDEDDDYDDEQGVAEAKWNPYDQGDFPINYNANDSDEVDDTGKAEKWQAMQDYYSNRATVVAALQAQRGLMHPSHGTKHGVQAVMSTSLGKRVVKTFPNKEKAYDYAGVHNYEVVEIKDTGLATNPITLNVVLGHGEHKKQMSLQFPDMGKAQQWADRYHAEILGQGMAEGDLNEFAADDGDRGGEDDALRNYARMWWAGDEATQMQIERALAKMGWEIGEDEGGYDNGGVFVVRAGDENGNSYQSWPAEDLTEGVAEGDLNEFVPAGRGPGDDDEEPGDDPYKSPKPEAYGRSIDFFGRFEADHFDKEHMDDATGVFKGYWDYDGDMKQIAYFKFDDPARTGSDDPGMGWYYEPQNESVAEGIDDEEYGPELAALKKEFGKFTQHYDRMDQDSAYAAQWRKQNTDRLNREVPDDDMTGTATDDMVHDMGQDDEDSIREGKPREKEADYGADYQDMVSRVKKLAGLGPLKTVYDPQKRVYKNVPTAVQPKKEQR